MGLNLPSFPLGSYNSYTVNIAYMSKYPTNSKDGFFNTLFHLVQAWRFWSMFPFGSGISLLSGSLQPKLETCLLVSWWPFPGHLHGWAVFSFKFSRSLFVLGPSSISLKGVQWGKGLAYLESFSLNESFSSSPLDMEPLWLLQLQT